MRTSVKFAGAVALLLASGTALAADHADGPGVKADAVSDINDVYTWVSSDKSKLELIMTIGGVSAPTAFGDKTQYVFHINRSENPLAASDEGTDTQLICEFASNTDAQCWLGTGDYVKGDPSSATGMASASGKFRVHAAAHADPFFFFLDGFKKAVDTVVVNAAALMKYASGCPKLDQATVTLLQGQLTMAGANPPIDNFKDLNSLGLVAEVDLDALPGTGNFMAVWAGTYVKSN